MLKTKREYKPDKGGATRARHLSSRHRLHRSSVRPFFCCGSQISLNSITELKDLPVEKEKTSEDDYEDLTDSDELTEDVETLQITRSQASLKSESSAIGTRVPISKRGKKAMSLHEKSNTRKKFWTAKLRGKLPISKRQHYASESKLNSGSLDRDVCVCTSYRPASTPEDQASALLSGARVSVPVSVVAHLLPSASRHNGGANAGPDLNTANQARSSQIRPLTRMDAPLPFIPNFNALYPTNDIDEQLIAQRRYEMEHGILEREASADDIWVRSTSQSNVRIDSTSSQENESKGQYPSYGAMGLLSQESLKGSDLGLSIGTRELACSTLSLNSNPWVPNIPRPQGVHTQVDYKHHLVPDMQRIISSSFYWGVMDRYQAEKLIENKPEGTFLLRDSAQDEFLFSVSFRRYGRSLHARIEQWNHRFSFDSRDPGVFATDSVCGLIEHYKDPSCCMFFEPMLALPLHRNFPFSLQHLSRAAIITRTTYDGINQLPLPACLKEFLRFYHYKQKVRVRRFDNVA